MHVFVGLPESKSGKIEKTYLYTKPIKKSGTKYKEVLWGDWLNVTAPDPDETEGTSKDKWFSFKYVRNKDGRLEAES